MRYQPRQLEPVLLRSAASFPAVVVTGPRQSGKTTTVRRLFETTHEYIALDLPDIRALAESDPRLFLAGRSDRLVLDEIQYSPRLLPYLREAIDRERDRMGRYILTGSQAFGLMAGVTESLAGRAAILTLPSLSLGESLIGSEFSPTSGEHEAGVVRDRTMMDLSRAVLVGGFPEVAVGGHPEPRLWHASYVQTYLERDVRQLRDVGRLADFQRFMVLLAHNVGGLLNLSEVSRDLGMAVSSLREWVSVLEASCQIALVRPWFANVRKRLVKTPKVYFLDTGTLCYLRGLSTLDQALSGMQGGQLLENLVFCELVKWHWAKGEIPRLSFFRTSDGHEVDFVLERGNRLIPIDVKLAATVGAGLAEGIEYFRRLVGPGVAPGIVACLCDTPVALTPAVSAHPLGADGLGRALDRLD
jgi:predicted AAA+ superfamily ATPase